MLEHQLLLMIFPVYILSLQIVAIISWLNDTWMLQIFVSWCHRYENHYDKWILIFHNNYNKTLTKIRLNLNPIMKHDNPKQSHKVWKKNLYKILFITCKGWKHEMNGTTLKHKGTIAIE